MARQADAEEGMGPMERGRLRYRQKDYNGALKAFNEAVEMSTDHLLFTALDSRAAVYEKLEQLLPALRDAKTMIETKPGMSKGYLRAGEVLQLQGKEALALKIYERGLQKVSTGTDKDRQHLVTFYEKLRLSLNPGESRDFLKRLPLELALMVVKNLLMRDRVICLKVSRGWKGVMESSPKLWTTLDTTYTRKAVTMYALKAYLKRSHYTIDRAIITMKAYIDADKMRYMTRTCKLLRELHIGGSGIIGDSLISALSTAKKLETLTTSGSTEVSLQTAQACLKTCNDSMVNLRFLNVKGSKVSWYPNRWPVVPTLKTLHLKADYDSRLDFDGLREGTPNAISITLNDWLITTPLLDATSWTHLERLDLTNTRLQRFPRYPSTLKHLNLSNNQLLHLGADEEKPNPLPLLETFACNWTNIDGPALKLITADSIKNGNLKRLTIGGRLVDALPHLVKDEFPPCDTLEELSLASMTLNDRSALEITGLYPNLKRLDISATLITGVTVKAVVKMGVEWLKINDCEKIGTDAVEWARGKGVDVLHSFPSQGGAGRGSQRFADGVFARGI